MGAAMTATMPSHRNASGSSARSDGIERPRVERRRGLEAARCR